MAPTGQLAYKIVGGLVPCEAGWLVVSAKLKGATFVPEFPRTTELLHDAVHRRPAFTVAAIDAPIAAVAEALTGHRTCDDLATSLMERDVVAARWGSWAPQLASASTPDEPPEVTLLRTRYEEVGEVMAPYLQRTICEVVPDFSFFQLNGERPLEFPPDTPAGYDERRTLLSKVPGITRVLDAAVPGITPRQLLDGSALLWTARRISARAAKRVPSIPEWDDRGLRIEILR